VFLGHFGLGLAAKRAAPTVSLGTLFLAVQFADSLWPLLLLLGVEHVRIAPGATVVTPLDFYDYPVSHSLLALAAWGLAFGALHFAVRRRRAAAIHAAGVVSHWVLDVLVHRPDLPVLPWGPHVGLGLWNSVAATVALGLWALLLLVAAVWVGSVLGPPPPSERALALSALAMWLAIPWGYWIDRHRAAAGGRIG
jgi:hypothetical protein